MELGFRIPQAKIFPDFEIQIPLHGTNVSSGVAIIVKFSGKAVYDWPLAD